MNQTITIRKVPYFLWWIDSTLLLQNDRGYVLEMKIVEKLVASLTPALSDFTDLKRKASTAINSFLKRLLTPVSIFIISQVKV